MHGRGASKPFAVSKPAPLWCDRFREPSVEELLAALPRSLASSVRHARGQLSDRYATRERVEWRGSLGWTLVHRVNGTPDPALAYVTLRPDHPALCLPIPEDVLASITAKRLSKPVREALAAAPVVGGVRWATWEVRSRAETDEVLMLLAQIPHPVKA